MLMCIGQAFAQNTLRFKKGQIGAGTVHPPIECFEKAIVAYAKKLGFEA